MDGDEKITDLIPEVNDSLIVGSPQGIQVVGPQRAAPKSVAAVEAESQQASVVISTPDGGSYVQDRMLHKQHVGDLEPIPPVAKMKPIEELHAEMKAAAPSEAKEFERRKDIKFNGGPFNGGYREFSAFELQQSEFGLLYFFREARGEIEQCVYRITLKEREKPELSPEATDEERAAWRAIPKVYDWVGEYEGKRRCPKPTVSGIRRESKG